MKLTVSTDPDLEGTSGNLLEGTINPYLETSDGGWQIDPEGHRYILNEFYGGTDFR